MFAKFYLYGQWKKLHRLMGLEYFRSDFDQIIEMYSSKGRHYHAVPHLVYGLKTIDKILAKEAPDLSDHDIGVLKLAFFFHDFIYDVHKKDNEELSAWEATHYLKDRFVLMEETCERITALILATKDHQGSTLTDPVWPILNDADLAILAAPEKVYRKYAENIWLEYQAVVPTREVYKIGRLKFLRDFVSRPIFKTETMKDNEILAISNLADEVDMLSC